MTTTRHTWAAARVKYIYSPWALYARIERDLVPPPNSNYTEFLIDHAPPSPLLVQVFGGEHALRRALDEDPAAVWEVLEQLEAGHPCRGVGA